MKRIFRSPRKKAALPLLVAAPLLVAVVAVTALAPPNSLGWNGMGAHSVVGAART